MGTHVTNFKINTYGKILFFLLSWRLAIPGFPLPGRDGEMLALNGNMKPLIDLLQPLSLVNRGVQQGWREYASTGDGGASFLSTLWGFRAASRFLEGIPNGSHLKLLPGGWKTLHLASKWGISLENTLGFTPSLVHLAQPRLFPASTAPLVVEIPTMEWLQRPGKRTSQPRITLEQVETLVPRTALWLFHQPEDLEAFQAAFSAPPGRCKILPGPENPAQWAETMLAFHGKALSLP